MARKASEQVRAGVVGTGHMGQYHALVYAEMPDVYLAGVVDIDPDDGVKWNEVAEAARQVNALLAGIGLRGFLKTTGGKGLHVVVPVVPSQPWDRIKGFSKAVADLFAATFPQRFTSKMSTKSDSTATSMVNRTARRAKLWTS